MKFMDTIAWLALLASVIFRLGFGLDQIANVMLVIAVVPAIIHMLVALKEDLNRRG